MKKKRMIYYLSVMLAVFIIFSETAAASPLSDNGRLRVSGSRIVNESGSTFVIKGVSTHGLAWYPRYVSNGSFRSVRQMGANTVRLAMYTSEYGGYCSGGNRTALKALIDKGVKAATSLGMYVVIDWHILSDGNPLAHKSSAVSFFKYTAKKYSSYKNVMFEICNEPNGSGGNWRNIKKYSSAVIKAIRSVNKKAIIIVGSPTWSQDIENPMRAPVSGKNIAYSFHFYAGTHKQSMRDRLERACKGGLPVIVTEFGLSNASGGGSVNTAEGNAWMRLLDKYGVGRICWSLSNKAETCSLIKPSCNKVSGWRLSDLSAEGRWLVNAYGGSLGR